jgi:hypothetical protein
MSLATPQNRAEFKKYLLTKLGAPVLQVNVSDEQLDLVINDGFQFFHEREHFNGTERLFYRLKLTDSFIKAFKTAEIHEVDQGEGPMVNSPGMVSELTLVSPGSGYPPTSTGKKTYVNQPTSTLFSNGGSVGTGLKVNWKEARTKDNGILQVSIGAAGENYNEGDYITLDGGNDDCIMEVSKVSTSARLNPTAVWEHQRNYIVMPDDVLGVMQVVRPSNAYGGMIGGVPGVGMTSPFLFGGGDQCAGMSGMGFDMISYYTMKQWLADLDFLMRGPISYEFNQRTHRLFLNTHNFGGVSAGSYILVECAVRPSPDVYPDFWNDLFVRRYCTALAKYQWGSNLIKFQQVQLPGGITMNGEMIYSEAKDEIRKFEERFALDYADPPLDMVG